MIEWGAFSLLLRWRMRSWLLSDGGQQRSCKNCRFVRSWLGGGKHVEDSVAKIWVRLGQHDLVKRWCE